MTNIIKDQILFVKQSTKEAVLLFWDGDTQSYIEYYTDGIKRTTKNLFGIPNDHRKFLQDRIDYYTSFGFVKVISRSYLFGAQDTNKYFVEAFSMNWMYLPESELKSSYGKDFPDLNWKEVSHLSVPYHHNKIGITVKSKLLKNKLPILLSGIDLFQLNDISRLHKNDFDILYFKLFNNGVSPSYIFHVDKDWNTQKWTRVYASFYEHVQGGKDNIYIIGESFVRCTDYNSFVPITGLFKGKNNTIQKTADIDPIYTLMELADANQLPLSTCDFCYDTQSLKLAGTIVMCANCNRVQRRHKSSISVTMQNLK